MWALDGPSSSLLAPESSAMSVLSSQSSAVGCSFLQSRVRMTGSSGCLKLSRLGEMSSWISSVQSLSCSALILPWI